VGRPAKPWYWGARGVWCVDLDGRRVTLSRGKDARSEATRAFHALMATRGQGRLVRPVAGLSVGQVCDVFLAHAESSLKPVTSSRYREYLTPFVLSLGDTPAHSITPAMVVGWLDSRPTWGATSRRNAVAVVKRAFSWSTRQGRLDRDPLLNLDKPRANRPVRVVDVATVESILAAADPAEFRDLLTILRETGCRVGEASAIEARNIDWERRIVVLGRHKTDSGGAPRVIHLTEVSAAILAEYAGRFPAGPVLRNSKGRPWCRNAVSCAMRRVRRRTGLIGVGAVPHALRHAFITDALSAGLSVAVVAELVGHRSTAMIDRVYSHLGERTDLLRAALDRVRPGG
jgi:integrase